jgi:hypothetical protein
MKIHLSKHGILPDESDIITDDTKKDQKNIRTMLDSSANLNVMQRLEKNLLRWIINDMQSFQLIENPDFKRLLTDIPGISMPFTSRRTLQRRVEEKFQDTITKLAEELNSTCESISLSLDVWTSKNY